MTRDQLISLFFIALLVFVVYEIFLIFSPFIQAIFWSAILAFAFYPLYQRLRRSLKPHETLAALLMTALIFLLVVPPVVILIVSLADQTINFYQAAVDFVRRGEIERLIDEIRSFAIVQRIESRLFQWEPLKENATSWIISSTREIGNFAAAQAATLTKNILLNSLNVLFMVFLLFVFLKDGKKIYQFIYQIAPLEEKTKRSIFRQINETFEAVIRGQILTSLVQATVAGTIFWILGLPLPLLFAALTFLTTLIPVAGASIVWVPFVIHLAATHQYLKAGILFILGLFVISVIDNIMKPALIGERTKLPYFLLFFGILGGIRLFGLIGIFIAPLILSLFFALTKIYQEKYL